MALVGGDVVGENKPAIVRGVELGEFADSIWTVCGSEWIEATGLEVVVIEVC